MLSILRWTVTISDSADESHAIYLHNLPHPTEDPYEVVWKHTKVGKLVNRAKSYSAFSGSRKAALELADKVEYWLTRHIRYASADLIIPAPPGNPDKAFDLPRFVADEVGGRLGLPVGLCTATGLTQPQKGVEQEIPELYSNIDGKYRAQSSLTGCGKTLLSTQGRKLSDDKRRPIACSERIIRIGLSHAECRRDS